MTRCQPSLKEHSMKQYLKENRDKALTKAFMCVLINKIVPYNYIYNAIFDFC
jgi:hypothetical protein